MNMRSGRGAGHGGAKSQKRDARALQVIDERTPFGAVGMKGYVNRVAVVEAETVVRRRLSDRARGKRAIES